MPSRSHHHAIRRPIRRRHTCQRAREHDVGLVVQIFGQLDFATAPEFRQRMTAALDEHPGPLIVDLSGLDFVDVTGLGALVEAHEAGDQRLVFLRGPERVHRLFQLLGLDVSLPFAD